MKAASFQCRHRFLVKDIELDRIVELDEDDDESDAQNESEEARSKRDKHAKDDQTDTFTPNLITHGAKSSTKSALMLESLSKRIFKRAWKPEYHVFQRVHYLRPVLRAAPTTGDQEPSETEVSPGNDADSDTSEAQRFSFELLPPLHRAAALGSTADVGRLINAGSNVNEPVQLPGYYQVDCLGSQNQYYDGSNPLALASSFGHLDVVKLLLSLGAEVNANSNAGLPALSEAIEQGNIAIVDFLLHNGALISNMGSGYNPLHWAVHMDQPHIVEMLLDFGIDVNSRVLQPSDWLNSTPLMLAVAKTLSSQTLGILLQHDADVNLFDADNKSAIHYAALVGNEGAMSNMLNLATKTTIDAQSKTGRTALMYANAKGHKRISEILLGQDADTTFADKHGNTVLHLAIDSRDQETAKLLPSSLDEATINMQNDRGKTALMNAAIHGLKETVKLLLEHGADTNFVDENGDTALSYAILSAIDETLGRPPSFTDEALNPFKYIRSKLNTSNDWNLHDSIAYLLIDHGAKPNNFFEGTIPLLALAILAPYPLFERLCCITADPDACSSEGVTALKLAAALALADHVSLLLKVGASTAPRCNEENTVLYFATIGGDITVLELILSASVSWLTSRDLDAAFMNASMMGETQVARNLLGHGANINSQNDDGDTAVMLAVSRNHVVTVQFLLEYGADTSLQNAQGECAVHIAAQFGHMESLELIMGSSTSLDVNDNKGNTPLTYAIANKDVITVEKLLNSGASADYSSKSGRPPLIEAVEFENEEIIQVLLSHGANVNVEADDGTSALIASVVAGARNIMLSLLSHRARVEPIWNYRPLLCWDSKWKDQDIAGPLLDAGADPTISKAPYCSALEYACIKGQVELVKQYLKHPNSSDYRGFHKLTPLHTTMIQLAFLNNNNNNQDLLETSTLGLSKVATCRQTSLCEVAKELLQGAVDVNALDEWGRTAVHFVAYSGNHKLLLDILESHEVDVSTIECERGWTALHFAVAGPALEQEKQAVIDLLLEYGANPHIRSQTSESYRDLKRRILSSEKVRETIGAIEKDLFMVYSSWWNCPVSGWPDYGSD
jgi:ankyrin repeat protein